MTTTKYHRKLEWANVGIRGLMEALIIIAFAWWGYSLGDKTLGKALLAIVFPAAGFGFWGLVDFRHTGKAAGPLRFTQELCIAGLASYGLFSAGARYVGWILVLLVVTHQILRFYLGEPVVKNA